MNKKLKNNMLPAISSLIKRNNFGPSDRKLLINISNYIEKTNNVLNVLMDAAPEEFDTLKEIADQLMNITTNFDKHITTTLNTEV